MFSEILLPVAQLKMNPLTLAIIGSIGGFVSSFLGVGSGIVITPALVMVGVPHFLAVASQLHNSVGTNFMGFLGFLRRGAVDFTMAWYIILGGVAGAITESEILTFVQSGEYSKENIAIIYAVVLTFLGILLLIQNISFALNPQPKNKNIVMRDWMIYFPWHRIFTRSRVEMSILVPIGVGFVTGLVTSTLGGGNTLFIMPIVSYLICRQSPVVAGTSLLAGAVITTVVIMGYAAKASLGDIVLIYCLIFGSFMGSRLGVKFRYYFPQYILGILGGFVVLAISFSFIRSAFFGVSFDFHIQGNIQPANLGEYSEYAKLIFEFSSTSPIVYGLLCLSSVLILGLVLERITNFVWEYINEKRRRLGFK
jgi:uncharacterized membrane protein YfcA